LCDAFFKGLIIIAACHLYIAGLARWQHSRYEEVNEAKHEPHRRR